MTAGPVVQVVLPPNLSAAPRVDERKVNRVVANRVNVIGEEQYLVQWHLSTPNNHPPLSWHTIRELGKCLELIQDYLEKKSMLFRKRKTPHDEHDASHLQHVSRKMNGGSRSPSVMSMDSTSTNQSPAPDQTEAKVYNGLLELVDGLIVAKSASGSGILSLDVDDVPTHLKATSMKCRTTEAEQRIRAEIIRRLRSLPGPRVSIVNTIDTTSPSLRFIFIEKCVLRPGVFQADPATQLGCTKCSPAMGRNIGCEYTKKCDCLEYAAVDEARLTEEQSQYYRAVQAAGEGDTTSLPKRFPYYTTNAKQGCLVPFYLRSRHSIYECNDRCKCGPDCRNKKVQFGRKVELEIFKTRNRGWGLRCKKDLREGEFIDTYRGEIITDEEATLREERAGSRAKNSYLYSLDKFAESQGLAAEDLYVIDGEFMGGPTKFMNHSCEPNCRQYTVSYNKHDYRIYDIAFFACRDIKAGEELTFDYLDRDEEDEEEDEEAIVEPGAVPCYCGAEKCRKWLWK